MFIGYARVSSVEQNLGRQLKMLKEFGCEYIVEEKASGKNRKERIELKKLLENKLRFGDVLVVIELSRLARSLQDLLNILAELKELEVDFVSIKENIDTRENNIYSKFMLQIIGAIAEFERDLTLERQREGIAIAKENGVYKGRKTQYHETAKGKNKLIYDVIVQSIKENKSVMDIHRNTGVSRNTIYKIRKQILNNEGNKPT